MSRMPTERRFRIACADSRFIGRNDDERRRESSTNAAFVENRVPETGTLTAPG